MCLCESISKEEEKQYYCGILLKFLHHLKNIDVMSFENISCEREERCRMTNRS